MISPQISHVAAASTISSLQMRTYMMPWGGCVIYKGHKDSQVKV